MRPASVKPLAISVEKDLSIDATLETIDAALAPIKRQQLEEQRAGEAAAHQRAADVLVPADGANDVGTTSPRKPAALKDRKERRPHAKSPRHEREVSELPAPSPRAMAAKALLSRCVLLYRYIVMAYTVVACYRGVPFFIAI